MRKSSRKRRKPRAKGIKKGPFLSLCMIVRDEEEALPGCLDDFGPIADQIVVVDTGSTDGTVDIARRYGAEVHHHPWKDDFSEARNWSLHYARGRMVLWVDADDRLGPGSAEALRREILAHEGKAVYLTLRNLEPGGGASLNYQLRAFPNHPSIRFEGRVHEQAAWAVKRLKLPFVHLPTEIIHTGYADADGEAIRRKNHRNRRMLEKHLRHHPDDLYAHYMLARTMEWQGEAEEAARRYALLLAHPKARSARNEFLLHAQVELATYHCGRGDVEKGRNFLEDVVAKAPEFALGRVCLGELYVKTGSFAEACNVLLPLVTEELKPSLIPMNSGKITQRASRYLGAALMGLGQWQEASICLEHALELRPTDQEARYWLGESLTMEGRLEEAEETLKACEGVKPDIWFHLANVALTRKDLSLAERHFRAAASAGFDSTLFHHNFGYVLAKQGDWEEAERHYRLVIERQPDMIDTLLNLGHGLMDRGRWDEAEEFFLKALALRPELLDARLAAAAFAFDRGEESQARGLAQELWQTLATDESKEQALPSNPSSLFLSLGEQLRSRGHDHLYDFCQSLAVGLANSEECTVPRAG